MHAQHDRALTLLGAARWRITPAHPDAFSDITGSPILVDRWALGRAAGERPHAGQAIARGYAPQPMHWTDFILVAAFGSVPVALLVIAASRALAEVAHEDRREKRGEMLRKFGLRERPRD